MLLWIILGGVLLFVGLFALNTWYTESAYRREKDRRRDHRLGR